MSPPTLPLWVTMATPPRWPVSRPYQSAKVRGMRCRKFTMPTVLGPTTCMPVSRHRASRRRWRSRPASPVRPSPKPPLISRQKGTPRRAAASTASKATATGITTTTRSGVSGSAFTSG